MNKIVVANWKLNPNTISAADKIATGYVKSAGVDIVVCPPTVFLQELSAKHKNLTWGAQDCFLQNSGAYTGQTSPQALKSIGVKYVILGHSEQREFNKSTDKEIGKKVSTAIKSGLTPILCVGGGLQAKQAGLKNISSIVKRQLKDAIKQIPGNNKQNKIIVAYEPVWAIGTGKNASPAHVSEMLTVIVKGIKSFKFQASSFKLLYGGSVNGNNISSFVDQNYLDGFLVGGASLKPKEFNKIIKVVAS